MENLFRPPEPLVLDGQIGENWKKFWQKFEVFLVATDLKAKPEETKIAVFLNLIGDDGLELHNSFSYTEDESRSLEAIRKKFEDYCSPQTNVIFERFKFNSIVQKEGQPFDSFLTELRKAIKTTQYQDKDNMIRDRIVIGIYDKQSQERMLRESKLTLAKCIDFCRTTEASKSQAQALQTETPVHAVNYGKSENTNASGKSSTISSKSVQFSFCRSCGYKHGKNARCPAVGKTCAKCQKKNHFAAVCSRKTPKDQERGKFYRKKVHNVEQEEEPRNSGNESDDSGEQFYVDCVNVELNDINTKCSCECTNVQVKCVESVSAQEKCWKQTVTVQDKPVIFKLDTGAEVSVIPLQILETIGLKYKLKPTKITLVSYGSDNFKIKPLGEVTLVCSVNDQSSLVDFVVVEARSQLPLLGLQGCLSLKLIKRLASISKGSSIKFNTLDDVTKAYKSVFDGLGEFPTKHHITLKGNAIPHVQPPRRVPKALSERLKTKLKQLESQGVIEKVEKPTEWLNPLVIVEKSNGDLRLCLDPKYLNQAIQREHFLIPTAEEIASKLSDKEYFTVLDMKDGYFQVKLDNMSSDYTTFGTPFGRYRFLRLPFGICSAPEVFQRKNYEIFGDLEGVGLYFDDLIITGSNDLEHDKNLQLVLERALKYNIKFNSSKIQFKSKSVKFMGQIYSKQGVEPNKNYVKAITDLPVPNSKTELLRILGMAKFLSKFLPNMSKVTAPLRDLTKQDVNFVWNDEHKQSLSQLKQLLVSAPILKYFDSTKPIEIETDASKDGLGACLLQNGHPIAFASRSLTSTEQKYAQIEKEMLAIVFSVQKFHFFIYGLNNIKINSDHKPLEVIFKKDLACLSPRLQRMRLRLLNYDIFVTYKPGKYLYIADTLSRAFLSEKGLKSDKEFTLAIHSVIKNIPMSNERKEQFRRETSADLQLKLVIDYCNNGWPENKHVIPEFVRNFYKIKESLTESDGLLLFCEKIVVPNSLRFEMLSLLHEGHVGIEKCKARARQLFYWPGINSDIENHNKKCKVCEKFSQKQQKESLHLYPLPKRPWERLGLDIFSYGGKSYLVVFDSYSNWLELEHIQEKSINSVIKVLNHIFCTFGSPDFVTCDNNPFNSYKFKCFCKDWNIKITLRSPHYPRSNGLAEKGVGIAKGIVKKSIKDGDIEIALLQYRNSPLKHIGYSPSQLLMSRICKTKIPICTELLKPILCQNVYDKLQNRQHTYQKYYNKSVKNLDPLSPQNNVTVYDHVQKKWDSGKIISKHPLPRSYLVEKQSGDIVRRNRIDIKPSLNPFIRSSENDQVINVNDRMSLADKNHVKDNIALSSDQPQTLDQTVYDPPDGSPKQTLETSLPVEMAPNSLSSQYYGKRTTRSGRIIRAPNRLNL